MAAIPPVVMRPHRPPSPSAQPAPEEKTKAGKKDAAKNQPPPEPEPELEVDENGGKTSFFCFSSNFNLWFNSNASVSMNRERTLTGNPGD